MLVNHRYAQEKILFLDIDGVLTSSQFFIELDRQGVTNTYRRLDPAAVQRLNRIIEATGAEVVVSSTWRLAMGLTDIRGTLIKHGFTGKVIGKTPRLNTRRGKEIRAWMESVSLPESQIIILDDSDDMEDLMHRLVRTSTYEGLQDEDVEKAIQLLGPVETLNEIA